MWVSGAMGRMGKLVLDEFPSNSYDFSDLSIIIPNFNQAQYLRELLQQLTALDGLEIIVLDGGSVDGSVEVLKTFDEKLAYWVSEPDQGQASAIKKGMRLATRAFICYQNSDDLFLIGELTNALKRMRSENLDIIYGPIVRMRGDRRIFDIQYYSRLNRLAANFTIPFNNQSLIMRRSTTNCSELICAHFDFCFDLDLAIKLVLNKKLKIKFLNFPWGALRYHERTKTARLQSLQQKEREAIARLLGYPRYTPRHAIFRIMRAIEIVFCGDWAALARFVHPAYANPSRVDGRRS